MFKIGQMNLRSRSRLCGVHLSISISRVPGHAISPDWPTVTSRSRPDAFFRTNSQLELNSGVTRKDEPPLIGMNLLILGQPLHPSPAAKSWIRTSGDL